MQQPQPGEWVWEDPELDWVEPEVAKVENSLCIFSLPHLGQTGFVSPWMRSSERSLHFSHVYS